jgi:hypothetical protein
LVATIEAVVKAAAASAILRILLKFASIAVSCLHFESVIAIRQVDLSVVLGLAM